MGDAYDTWWPVGAPMDMYSKVSWAVDRADQANDRGQRAKAQLILDRIELWKPGWGVGRTYPDSEVGKVLNRAGRLQLKRARTIRLELRAELEGDRLGARNQRTARVWIERDIRRILASADFEKLSNGEIDRKEFEKTVNYWHKELDRRFARKMTPKVATAGQ